MKKRWKIFAIVCASIMGFGILLCVAGCAIGATDSDVRAALRNGFGHFGIGTWIYETDTSATVEKLDRDPDEILGGETFENVRNIELNVSHVEVRIAQQDVSEEISVDAEVLNELDYKCYMEGDTLKITTKNRKRHINHGGTITIYIPAGMEFDEMELSVGEGVLTADYLHAREADINVGAGTAEIAEIRADELEAVCGAGSMDISGDVRRKADIECGMGEAVFHLEGGQEDFNYELELGMGSVAIGGSEFGGMAVEKTIRNNAAKEMSIECGMGSVTIDFEE